MSLTQGALAPLIAVRTPTNPAFHLGSVGGHYVLLGFLPPPGPERDAATSVLGEHLDLFESDDRIFFGVVPDAGTFAQARDRRMIRWIDDAGGEVRRALGAAADGGGVAAQWVLLDPALRVIDSWPIGEARAALAAVRALPDAGDYAGGPIHAPVLIVPRIFEPALCRRLIDLYEEQGGERSGVMRERDGRTVAVTDSFKSRRDATVPEGDLRALLRQRIGRCLLPEIEKAFQFRATRIERYIVSCYDAQEGGYFRPHRDDTTAGTAHRRFAVSINLNADAFSGGDLRFPEFGPRVYRPPTGGAVVFCCSLLHEATPVTKGRRYAFLPFLYDEEGARVREANLHLVEGARPAG